MLSVLSTIEVARFEDSISKILHIANLDIVQQFLVLTQISVDLLPNEHGLECSEAKHNT